MGRLIVVFGKFALVAVALYLVVLGIAFLYARFLRTPLDAKAQEEIDPGEQIDRKLNRSNVLAKQIRQQQYETLKIQAIIICLSPAVIESKLFGMLDAKSTAAYLCLLFMGVAPLAVMRWGQK